MYQAMSSKKTIGIDLGTTNSYVGIVIRGSVEIVQNEHGKRGTPSCVAFKDMVPLIGTTAVDQVDSNMENTIFGSKHFIGRTFEDSMRNDLGGRGFQVVQGDDQLPKFVVHWGSGTRYFSPEEISSLIIYRMKEITEAHIGSAYNQVPSVDGLVVAVPACFSSSQRQATKDAAIIAGFEEANIHIITEPIAAAIAYENLKETKRNRAGKHNLLVIDMGGGKCEASIVTTIHRNKFGEKESYFMKWTSGCQNLGGDSIDESLASFAEKKIQSSRIHSTSNCKWSDKTKHSLRAACRSLKEKLCIVDVATMDVHLDGTDYKMNLTHASLELGCTPTFEEISKLLSAAIDAARAVKEQIDDYILIGSTTRMPKIRALIKELLRGREPALTINPDEAVAYGAALYAESVENHRKLSVENKFSLWIETADGYVTDVPPQQCTIQPSQQESPKLEELESQRNTKTLEVFHIDLRPPGVEITLITREDGTQELIVIDKISGMRNTHTSATLQGCMDEEKVHERIEEAKLRKKHEHVRELVAKKVVSERELKQFESALIGVRDPPGSSTKRREKIEKVTKAYENITRSAQEKEEFKRRNWRKSMCFTENAWLPTTKHLYFERDGNNTLHFQVFHRIDEKNDVVEMTGEIPPIAGISETPLKLVLDKDGILDIVADETIQNKIKITARRVGCIQKDQVARMAVEHRKYREHVATKRALETLIYDTSGKVKEWMRSERITKDHRNLFTAHREARELLTSDSDRNGTSLHDHRLTKTISDTKTSLDKLYKKWRY